MATHERISKWTLFSAMLLFILMFPFGSVARSQGHHVVILGDSNSWLGGDSCDIDLGWTKWFKQYYRPETCRSYARSGATWTNTSSTHYDVESYSERLDDQNVIMNQVNRLIQSFKQRRQTAPDVIIVSAGTNDVWFKSARPFALNVKVRKDLPQDNEMTTLESAVRENCTRLLSYFPTCKIVLLTPMETVKASISDIRQAGDIIERTAQAMNQDILVIRLDKLSHVKRGREMKSFFYTSDGTHTNRRGAQSNGHLIANHLKSKL